jgi:predicted acetyltransferase
MPLDLRPLESTDVERAFTMLESAFGGPPHPADVPVEVALVQPPERFYAVWDGAEPVATAGSFDFTMTVPGGSLPVAGVTWVGVLATHRRRGLLRAMMRRQLVDLHAAGTAVAALWASEAAIYGRYGYGPAAWMLTPTLPSGAAFRFPIEPGGVRLVEPSAAALQETYEQAARVSPGWPQRDDAWWAYRLHDPEHRRDGASPLRCALTEGGYALFATTSSWVDGLPAGQVRVRELVATSSAASARLWRFLLDIDLMREVRAPGLAADDPLLLDLLAEPRVAKARLSDCLHVRLVDVPAALAARRYAAPVDVVLAVEDEHCPWNTGRWRLTGDRDGASCAPTDDEPDLVLAPSDLGAAYLGGTPLRSRAVREQTPGALARATTAFGPLDRAPWCPQVF